MSTTKIDPRVEAVRALVLDCLRNRNEAASLLADLHASAVDEIKAVQEEADRKIAEIKARAAEEDSKIRGPFDDAASEFVAVKGPGEYRNPLQDGASFKVRRYQERSGKGGRAYFVDLLPKLPAVLVRGNGATEETTGNGPRDF